MNPETRMSLDEAVAEVLGILTGLDLSYDPRLDRYCAITRQLNRAIRSNALEKEWSYYSSTESIGPAEEGLSEVFIRSEVRPRVVNDDAVRLCDPVTGQPKYWAYFLPRDALSKYAARRALWCAVTRNTLAFSRPFNSNEHKLDIQLPVMREPTMFRLPVQPEDPEEDLVEVPAEIRNQPIDFPYPDVIILRAAFYYAQTDPVMQPRVQTIEAQYKDLMYQVIERDDRNTDSPYLNEFYVPVQNDLVGDYSYHGHPHSDERR